MALLFRVASGAHKKNMFYKIKATSTAERTIKLAMMSTDDKYRYYGGDDIVLESGKEYSTDFLAVFFKREKTATFIVSQ